MKKHRPSPDRRGYPTAEGGKHWEVLGLVRERVGEGRREEY